MLLSKLEEMPLNTALSGVLRIEALVVESDEIPKVVEASPKLLPDNLPKSLVPAMMML